MRRFILAVAVTLAIAAQFGTPTPAARFEPKEQTTARVTAVRRAQTSERVATESNAVGAGLSLLMGGVGSTGVLR